MSQQQSKSQRSALTNKKAAGARRQPNADRSTANRQATALENRHLPTVYKPLDAEEFRLRIEGSFPSVYMTNISIVQGAALSLLAYNTFSYISSPLVSTDWYLFLPYSFVSFLVLLVVSYEYNWFVGLFRWSPKFSDTFITFFLGFFQIGPLLFLTNPKSWWFANAIFTFSGAIAYANTYRNTKPSMFTIDKMYLKVRSTIRTDIVLTIVMSIILVAIGFTHPDFDFKALITQNIWYFQGGLWTIIAPGIYALLLAVIIWKDSRFLRSLHSDFGIEY